jgi:glycosidase
MIEIDRKSRKSLDRLLPRLGERFANQAMLIPYDWREFIQRVEDNFPNLFKLYYELYATQYDFFYHLEELLFIIADMWLKRSGELKTLDTKRSENPLWFQSQTLLGGVCYVDLFAGDLNGIQSQIQYFKELGLTYLHLMPIFRVPESESDGGYAVSSYREINSALGNLDQLVRLAEDLRKQGISLVLDFVINHTSDEHDWAIAALAGDPDYQQYYRMFPDRKMPDLYEVHLREIFPDEHPGSFTYRQEIRKWVWTTFHNYQWDLNYENPVVFNRMVAEMLFLANIGVEVLRLDALAFIWKELGTSCENLPEAHKIIQAFNSVVRIAAPAMLFKSEAIVHPDEVNKYIAPGECQISYNPLIMALIWNSLATREVGLLNSALRERFSIGPCCAWVNYVRSHDDIGWTFSDDDAASLGINAYDHRKFLNDFYTGRFVGSFARGLPFQENPKTGDVRVSGTCASLAGLEQAIMEETKGEVELAIRRILLIHAVILTIGGIPLIYLGDEVGTINDYSYRDDPAKASDSRWVHRPYTDWKKNNRRTDKSTPEGRIYHGLNRLIKLRSGNPVFAGNRLQVINTENNHVLGYVRSAGNTRVLIFANFSEQEQIVPSNILRLYGLSYKFTDLINGESFSMQDLILEPYGIWCLSS